MGHLSKYLAHGDVFTEPRSLAKATRGPSVGIASMEYEGTDERARL